MDDSKLFELFPEEYRELILRYKSTLHRIFDNYEVVIFMARKAVCFYKALVIGKYINKPQKCKVFSNRVLTYNVTNNFKGKKIIVIDDVMIKGESLCKTLNTLYESGIKADVYIMARPKEDKDKPDILANANIIESFEEMSEDDTQQLSKHITDFIEASVCPYNIDQPIYNFSHFNDEIVTDFADKYNLVDISSGLQQKYGISSYVLKIPNKYITNVVLKDKVNLCKIRFLYGRYNDTPVFLAIPFVLMGEMQYTELKEAFSYLDNERLNKYIYNENEKLFFENQLKILHYILAVQLMDAFLGVSGINTCRRLDINDDFIFAKDMSLMVSESKNPFNFTAVLTNDDISYDLDFVRTEYLDLVFDFLYSDKMIHSNYYDSRDKPIKDKLLVLSELEKHLKWIREQEEYTESKFNTLAFSIVIDILIDAGLIIPTIVHEKFNEAIIRAYKFGEVYALNENHFKLFTYALIKYLNGINRTIRDKLPRTEFEKLCVLFFRDAVSKNILKFSEASGNEDEYRICLSKFGPRVSTSKPEYAASEISTLATKLLCEYIETDDVIIEQQKQGDTEGKQSRCFKVRKYYKINNEIKINNKQWEEIADNFAKKYKIIYNKLFTADNEGILFEDVRNMYMRSYTEFLVLLSIGSSRKEQLLSLLAELYLLNSIETNNGITNILMQFCRILDGLISGMWKYMCYAQPKHPIQKLCENLEAKDENEQFLGVYIREIFITSRDVDKNECIEQLIDEAGKLIFSIAFSIWFMLKKYNFRYTRNDEYVDLEKDFQREFFYRDLKDIRKTIEDQTALSTSEQDQQVLIGYKLEAKKLIGRYETDIATGKKQPKKRKESTINKITINNYYDGYFEQSLFANEIQGDITNNFLQVDIDKFNKIAHEIKRLAVTQNLKEKDEIIHKMDELHNEILSKKPDKNKAYQIVDWIHKITGISNAVANLYKLFAPSLGLPPIP
jgi:hypothetical protein